MGEESYSFLPKQIMQHIYNGRKKLDGHILYNTRIEKVKEGNYVEIWFMTKGCQWDAKGGCTICNYGKGMGIDISAMIQSVSAALNEVDVEIGELAITPSGSLLDEEEVPKEVCNKIFDLVNETAAHTFLFETRAQTVKPDKIKELTSRIKNKKLVVEMGLETGSFFLQKYCINKGYFLREYENAVQLLKKNNISVYANVVLGTPFLTMGQALRDCQNALNWALTHNTEKVVLFPLHVKPGTMLEWLYQKGYYKPVSLWGLVEVLGSIDENLLSRVEISWYKNYYTDKSKIIASPYTCDCCYDGVIRLLDEFRETSSKETIIKLRDYPCNCKSEWKETGKEKYSVKERIFEIYGEMAVEFMGSEYWHKNRDTFKQELEKDYEGYNMDYGT